MPETLSIDANAAPTDTALPADAASTNPNANISIAGKIDASSIGTPVDPTLVGKPEHIPAKFWKDGAVDYDSLVKSYTELEKRFTTTPTAAPTPAPVATPTDAPVASQTEAPVSGAVTTEALNAFTTEYETTGTLSEDSYKRLESDFKLPRDIVDAYIQGQVAARTIYANELIEEVGGEAKYIEMCKAARASWTPQQIEEFGKETESANPAKIKAAVDRLSNWYTTEFGGQGNLIQGETGVVADGGYRSNDDILNAMRDPKYAVSETFRKEVERKAEIFLRRNGKIR